MTDLKATLSAEAQEKLAIRELVSTYADGVNRYDPKTWGSTWAEDAQWSLREGQALQGREAIVAFWCSVMDTLAFAIMIPSSCQIEVNGDTAVGRWYMNEVVKEAEGRGAEIVGVYNDVYVKRDGRWYFMNRRYHMLYDSPVHENAIHTPIPAEHLVPVHKC